MEERARAFLPWRRFEHSLWTFSERRFKKNKKKTPAHPPWLYIYSCTRSLRFQVHRNPWTVGKSGTSTWFPNSFLPTVRTRLYYLKCVWAAARCSSSFTVNDFLLSQVKWWRSCCTRRSLVTWTLKSLKAVLSTRQGKCTKSLQPRKKSKLQVMCFLRHVFMKSLFDQKLHKLNIKMCFSNLRTALNNPLKKIFQTWWVCLTREGSGSC